MSLPPLTPEDWTEKVVVEQLRAALANLPGAEMWSGQAMGNRFAPTGLDLVGMRRFITATSASRRRGRWRS
jgi:hypothetical protein